MAYFIFLDDAWPLAATDTGRERYARQFPLAGRFEAIDDFQRAYDELHGEAIRRAVEMQRMIAADEISAAVMVAARELR